MDTGTGLAALAMALGGKELMVKLLGPTFDELSEYPLQMTGWMKGNLLQMFKSARRRADLNVEGRVRPRALVKILQNAALTDDALSAEYFGGLLAAARTEEDDKSAFFADLVGRLSARQVLAHYAIYSEHRPGIVAHFENTSSDFVEFEFDAIEAIEQALRPLISATGARKSAAQHACAGLFSVGLLREAIGLGPVGRGRHGVVRGFASTPARLGIELFAAAHGYGLNDFHKRDIPMTVPSEIFIRASDSVESGDECA